MTSNTLLSEGRLNKYIEDSLLTKGNLNEFIKEIMADRVPVFNPHSIINSTTFIVGDMGLSQRFDYICHARGFNLASRVERQTKPCYIRNVLRPVTAMQTLRVTI